jgi:WD40 repeat protein
MSAGADYTIRLWDTANWQEIQLLKGHRDEISAAVFSRDGTMIISGDKDGWVKAWSAAVKPRESTFLQMPSGWVLDKSAIAYNASSIVLLHTNGNVSLWDGPALHQLPHPAYRSLPAALSGLAVSPGGQLMAVSTKSGQLEIWDLVTAKESVSIQVDVRANLCFAFSSNGRSLVVGGGAELGLWDTQTHEPVTRLSRIETSPIVAVTLAPNGESVGVALMSGTVEVWNLAKKSYSTWKAHKGQFVLAFLPDGKALVTAGRDGNLKLWDVATQKPKLSLGRTSNAFYSVAIIPDGSRVAAGTASPKTSALGTLNHQKFEF